MYLLTEWDDRMGKYWAQGYGIGLSAVTESQIFSCPAQPTPVNKYFIIPPLLHYFIERIFRGTFECVMKA